MKLCNMKHEAVRLEPEESQPLPQPCREHGQDWDRLCGTQTEREGATGTLRKWPSWGRAVWVPMEWHWLAVHSGIAISLNETCCYCYCMSSVRGTKICRDCCLGSDFHKHLAGADRSLQSQALTSISSTATRMEQSDSPTISIGSLL